VSIVTLGFGPPGSIAEVVLLGFSPAPVAARVGPTRFASTAVRVDDATSARRPDPHSSTAEAG
jgi:hypothetical protein